MRFVRLQLRDRLARRLERLRLELLDDEALDDPRHAVGRRPEGPARVAGQVTTLFEAQPGEGLVPAPLSPPPEALQVVQPGTVWDVTTGLVEAASEARRRGHRGVLVVLELSSCLHSERLRDELKAARAVWESAFTLLRLRVGDRLNKAYIREVQLADVRLVLTSLPLTLVLELAPEGLRFSALALDPLGPARDHRRLRALLSGEPQLAPGAEQETLRVHTAAGMLELDQRVRFFQPFQLAVFG